MLRGIVVTPVQDLALRLAGCCAAVSGLSSVLEFKTGGHGVSGQPGPWHPGKS